MTDTFFPLGASYYPPHHAPQDWARDVAAMADAGMTCIRLAELLASWDYIAPVRGAPNWGWLDALFDAAHAHGLRILLGTGSPNPPIWLRDRYPDVPIIDRDGHPLPYKALLLPAALLIDAATGAALQRFVEHGGTLVAGATCAWVDRRGWSWANQPGAELARLFGVQTSQIERIDGGAIELVATKLRSALDASGAILACYGHRQMLQPAGDARMLGTFADGCAALVQHQVGAGQTFYAGTHLDVAALELAPWNGAMLHGSIPQ